MALVDNETRDSRSPATTLWYESPAAPWHAARHGQNTVSDDALPIGNGSLGAMICGHAASEVLHLNEDTLWSGVPCDPTRPGAVRHFRRSRAMAEQGNVGEAGLIAMEHLRGDPNTLQAFQPLADLLLSFPGHDRPTQYSRGLDLAHAIAWVTYVANGVTFRREYLASYPDRVLAVRITASQPGQITFAARFHTWHLDAQSECADDRTLGLSIQVGPSPEPGDFLIAPCSEKGLRAEVRLRVDCERGRVTVDADTLTVTGADTVTLYLAAATSFNHYADISADAASRVRASLNRLNGQTYAQVRDKHVADYAALFGRASLDLRTGTGSSLPTARRIANAGAGDDPALMSLYFNFGRYLLISSSRPGGEPANLQGVWNQDPLPAWGSKYTTNINLQMNYWPAETGNLSELCQPLFALIRDVSKTGQRVAQEHYGCRGWVLHHNTDLWRAATPVDWDAALWPMGSAWLCTHLWQHFLFTQDRSFLEEYYPILHDASLFYLDFLIEHPKHREWLVTWPSHSPEHGGVVLGPTMDMQILREHFAQTIEAARILGVDEGFRHELDHARQRLVPNQIGKHGQLQEWVEDKDDPADQHRHVSHLWGVYPGSQIDTRLTPELASAARRSLEFRGDGGTGWSRAWKIVLWARLRDGDRAYRLLSHLLRESTYPNLFDAHPPFQIDGNSGATAGIIELLLQSHAGCIELLPALPAAWQDGSVRGLRARGGITIDIEWRGGRLDRATLSSAHPARCTIRYRDREREVVLAARAACQLGPDLDGSAT